MLESPLPPEKEPFVPLPDLPGVLSAAQIRQTAESIAEWQLPNGMIPWFPGGHADAWNHVEAAMALDVAGLHDEAARAYQWLADIQRPDGAWHHYYLADGIEQDKLDANCVAYIATGVWHRYLVTGDRGFLEAMWGVVEPAIEFVLDLQTPRGEIRWARHADGTPWSFALRTGSSSISHSLRAAIAIAEELGHERPGWELGGARLAHVIRTVPDAFAPKVRWAMDWYYPVLAGVVTGEAGLARLEARKSDFEMDSRGVRCVSDRPWITTAETCESAMAYLGLGQRQRAMELFESILEYRSDDGRYLTGMVYPEEITFPEDERSTYSAAAVILAADALAQATPAAGLLADHHFLPDLMSLGNDIALDADVDAPSLD